MIRQLSFVIAVGSVFLPPCVARAQGGGEASAPQTVAPDSIVVLGLRRVERRQVLEQSGLAPGRTVGYRDIQRATQIARRMVTQWGMSDKVGTIMMGQKEELVFLGRDLGEQRTYSEEVAAIIDSEVKNIIDEAYDTARNVLTEQKSKMDAVVEKLKVVETIDRAELDEILAAQEQEPAAIVRKKEVG